MKRIKKIIYLLLFVGFIAAMNACSKDEIMIYNDADYVQFINYVTDSSTCSFLASPNTNELEYPLVVEAIGSVSSSDREYKLGVVPEYTTAPSANYRLPDRFTMKAGKVIDTCYITMIKTPQISQQAVRLTLRVEETSAFKVGQTNKSAAIIYISNVISQPAWWTTNIINNFLGEYSDKKYKLFIEVTGIVDLDTANVPEMRAYTLMFKNWLQMEKDAGRTVYEEDGREMSVSFYGG